MKRPLAYITAAWLGGDSENAELAAQYCRTVYEAGLRHKRKNHFNLQSHSFGDFLAG